MIILLLFILSDYNIMNRLPQPDYVERDWEWMQADPNMMESYFRIYEEVEGESHILLVIRNYMRYNPLRKVRTGRRNVTWSRMRDNKDCEHPDTGNVNGDDVVDLADYSISAEYYYGDGMFYVPEPEPKLEPVTIPIEIKAFILRLLMDD